MHRLVQLSAADRDAAWRERWQVEPVAAMVDVVREHRQAIQSRARQICGDDRATDVGQEVFLRFWQHPLRYEPSKGSLGSFLLMMTTGIAIDVVRRDARRRLRDEAAGRAVARVAFDPPDVADPITSRRVQEALSTLNADQRDAVLASIVDELVHREIAASRGIPEGTVKSRIRLGMHRLRDQLRDVHEPPEAATCG